MISMLQNSVRIAVIVDLGAVGKQSQEATLASSFPSVHPFVYANETHRLGFCDISDLD
jgi:hypothetical protein